MISKNNLEAKDLSKFDHPITNMFDQPQSPEEWKPFILPQEQVDFYRENGYLTGIKILTDKQVKRLNEELAGLTEISEERKKLFYH